jgi:menaquinone-dependent protoporphyrinogen IX oxidase
VGESLREIGSEVKVLEDAEVKADNLAQYDAVVIGVRASERASESRQRVDARAARIRENGGVVIMQYTTTPGPKPEHLPYPLKVSRDRVTG